MCTRRVEPAGAAATRVAAEDLEALLGEIRERPGYAGFLLPLPAAELRAAATAGPVVLVNVSDLGSHALIVTADRTDTVALPDIGPGVVAATEAHFAAVVAVALAEAPASAARDGAESVIEDVLGWLWDAVAEPVLDALGELAAAGTRGLGTRLWWSATARAVAVARRGPPPSRRRSHGP